MRNFIRQLSYTALIAGSMFVTVTETDAQTRKGPTEARFFVGEPRRVGTSMIKTRPTGSPVVDSNAILNLDYKELRSSPVAVPKPAAPVAPVAPKEPTLAELKLQLKTAQDNLKAANLAHKQAVRSKDKTRVEQSVKSRDSATKEVTRLKKAVAAKEPVKATVKQTSKKRATPKKQTAGAERAAGAAPATATPTAK